MAEPNAAFFNEVRKLKGVEDAKRVSCFELPVPPELHPRRRQNRVRYRYHSGRGTADSFLRRTVGPANHAQSQHQDRSANDFDVLHDSALKTHAVHLAEKEVHPVNGEVPPVKGRPRKLPHYANRGKTSSSGGELASARSCFSTVRTALGKLRIAGLLAQFDVARSFPQFPRPLLLQPTILTSERGTRFGIRKPPNHVPPPHLPDDPKKRAVRAGSAPRSRIRRLRHLDQFQQVAIRIIEKADPVTTGLGGIMNRPGNELSAPRFQRLVNPIDIIHGEADMSGRDMVNIGTGFPDDRAS